MPIARAPRRALTALFSLLVILTITVVFQNLRPVQATVFFRTITLPLALLLILTLAAGMLSGAVLYRAMIKNRPRR